MKKNRINEYTLLHGNKDTFEKLFSIEDPWNLYSRQEQYRYEIVMDFIKKNFYKSDLEILEIGCAEGNFSEYLEKESINATAIDISEIAIDRAKRRNLKNVNFVCTEMLNYIQNEKIDSYDIILLMECFYYLSSKQRNIFLKELAGKINAETKIILTMPVRRKHTMFLPESELTNVFKNCGFIRDEKYGNVVLSLKGINGKLSGFIPTIPLKKLFILMHKIFFPFRINQKLFVFKKI